MRCFRFITERDKPFRLDSPIWSHLPRDIIWLILQYDHRFYIHNGKIGTRISELDPRYFILKSMRILSPTIFLFDRVYIDLPIRQHKKYVLSIETIFDSHRRIVDVKRTLLYNNNKNKNPNYSILIHSF